MDIQKSRTPPCSLCAQDYLFQGETLCRTGEPSRAGEHIIHYMMIKWLNVIVQLRMFGWLYPEEGLLQLLERHSGVHFSHQNHLAGVWGTSTDCYTCQPILLACCKNRRLLAFSFVAICFSCAKPRVWSFLCGRTAGRNDKHGKCMQTC